jgi:tetratricopeptide (TPR) repeat protein
MNRFPALLLLLSIGLSIEVAAGAPQENRQPQAAPELFQKAAELFQHRQYEQALAAVNAALRSNPDFAPALTLKARLAMTSNRFDVARACLQKAVELEPRSAENYFLLGFALYVDNDFARALQSLERAAELRPGDARTEFYLALTYDGMGRVQEAIDKYEAAFKFAEGGKDSDLIADTLVAYARLLFTLGQFDKSERLIDRALGINPNLRDAQYEKGRLRLEMRDADGAIVHGKRALELPGVGVSERQIHFLLARAYTRAGQKELAEIHLAKFRASPPPLRR